MSVEAPLSPLIANQLSYLLSNSPLSLKVDRIWSGCKNSRYSDHFTLSVPFCLDYTRWDFLYDAMYPLEAPDIVFAAEDGGFNPLVEISGGVEGDGEVRNSSLKDWDSKDPSRLLNLVHEIRDLYLEYQRKRVGELGDERLKFETSTILSREGIEVCMISGLDKAEEVKFVVPLLMDVDLNKLVHGCPWRHQQKIYLEVVFPVSRGSSLPPSPQIKLVSHSDLKALITVEDIKLPPWVNRMCMAEYLPTLEDNLKVQVMEAVAAIGGRRRFMEALAPVFGRPVEADSVFCRKATVFATSGTFTFLVHFSIPTQFPRMQPVLTMQSCQHFNSHGLAQMSSPLNGYPWSPRWDASEMAERIFEYLADECLNFKKHCTEVMPQ